MPAAVPIFMGGMLATGVTQLVGAAAISAITGATVSAAVATAVGSGIVAGGITAIRGGSVSDVLKSAVVSGVASYAGQAIGKAVGNSVTGALDTSVPSTLGAYGADIAENAASLSGVAGKVLGSVSQGITTNLIKGQPIEAGAISGLASGVADSLDAVFKSSPKWDSLGKVGQEAVKAATAASIAGGSPKDAAIAAALQSSNILGMALDKLPDSAKQALQDSQKSDVGAFLMGTVSNTLSGLIGGKKLSDAAKDGVARQVGTYIGNALKSNLGDYLKNAQAAYAKAQQIEQKVPVLEDEYKNLADTYTQKANQYNTKAAERQKLLDNYNSINTYDDWYSKLAPYASDSTDFSYAEYNRDREKALNDLNQSTQELNAQWDAISPDLDKIKSRLAQIENEHSSLISELEPTIKEVENYSQQLAGKSKEIFDDTKVAVVKGINPNFDPKEYAKNKEYLWNAPADLYIDFLDNYKEDAPLPGSLEEKAAQAWERVGYTPTEKQKKDLLYSMKIDEKYAFAPDALARLYADRAVQSEGWEDLAQKKAAIQKYGETVTPAEAQAKEAGWANADEKASAITKLGPTATPEQFAATKMAEQKGVPTEQAKEQTTADKLIGLLEKGAGALVPSAQATGQDTLVLAQDKGAQPSDYQKFFGVMSAADPNKAYDQLSEQDKKAVLAAQEEFKASSDTRKAELAAAYRTGSLGPASTALEDYIDKGLLLPGTKEPTLAEIVAGAAQQEKAQEQLAKDVTDMLDMEPNEPITQDDIYKNLQQQEQEQAATEAALQQPSGGGTNIGLGPISGSSVDTTKIQQQLQQQGVSQADMEAALQKALSGFGGTFEDRLTKALQEQEASRGEMQQSLQGQITGLGGTFDKRLAEVLAEQEKNKADLESLLRGEITGLGGTFDQRLAEVLAEQEKNQQELQTMLGGQISGMGSSFDKRLAEILAQQEADQAATETALKGYDQRIIDLMRQGETEQEAMQKALEEAQSATQQQITGLQTGFGQQLGGLQQALGQLTSQVGTSQQTMQQQIQQAQNQAGFGNMLGLLALLNQNKQQQPPPIPVVGQIKPFQFSTDLLEGIYPQNKMGVFGANDQLLKMARG